MTCLEPLVCRQASRSTIRSIYLLIKNKIDHQRIFVTPSCPRWRRKAPLVGRSFPPATRTKFRCCDGRKLHKDGRLRGSGADVLMLIHGRASTFYLGKRASFTDFASCATGRRPWNSQRHLRRTSYQMRKSQRMIWICKTGKFQSKFPKSQTPMVQVSQPLWRLDEGAPYRRCAYVGVFCGTE